MGLFVDLLELLDAEAGKPLGGLGGLVAEDLLDISKVTAPLNQQRGNSSSEEIEASFLVYAGLLLGSLDDTPEDQDSKGFCGLAVEEEGFLYFWLAAKGEEERAHFEDVILKVEDRSLCEGKTAAPCAFAGADGEKFFFEVHIFHFQGGDLFAADSSGEEEF